MAHINKYYIVDVNDPNLPQIYDVIVGKPSKQRPNNPGSTATKLAVKLHKGDHNNYPFLDGIQKYNHAGIRVAMNTPEWQKEMPI